MRGWIRSFAEKGNIRETLDRCVGRIRRFDADLKSFVRVECEDIPAAVESAELNSTGRLRGVPIAIKDNLSVKGWEVTCSSAILKGYTAPYDATVIERLRAEGAIFVGRTNMDEFAFGSSCETSVYGPTHNPWDLARVPGGSSGGSAAAVAADLVPAALGSDTGGSIRQPAAFCGIVGLKPTYGRVSRYGLVAFASSLDQIGPMTRSVEDAAILMEVMAGRDGRDSTSSDRPVPAYTAKLGESIRGLKIGMPEEYFAEGLDPEVRAAVEGAVGLLTREGARVVPVRLPSTRHAVPVYYVIGPSEASSNLARFDGVRFGNRDLSAETLGRMYESTRSRGFGAEAKRRILLGTYALSSGYYDAYYLKAMKVRRKIIDDFDAAFREADLLVSPTAPSCAFRIGEKSDDPISMYLSDVYTISANLAGIPALSLPCGLSKSGLPIGIQFMGRPFDEETLLKTGFVLEEKTGWANRAAPAYSGAGA